MATKKGIFDKLYDSLLSERVKKKSEKAIVLISIISFLVHLALIMMVDFDLIELEDRSKLLNNPIAAIYTPFSFILLYEVYLLVYYLPKSITSYIAKQYEIITLIIIRRIFKDLSNLELTSDWFKVQDDLQFTYDIIATLLLFFMIYLFYRLNEKRIALSGTKDKLSKQVTTFIRQKHVLALILVPIFLILAVYRVGQWIYNNFFSLSQMVDNIRDVNNIFFDEFFTILILTDVLLLLLSLFFVDTFSKVIRNSGFIISTILIRLSFGVEGLLNTVLVVVAVLFGLSILAIHNQYEKLKSSNH